MELSNFLYIDEKISLQWVEDPLDYDDETPMKIGFCGINGTGKSTALSRAFPWLMHPISNSLESDEPNESDDSKGFANPGKPIEVKAVFEWDSKFYEARRILYPDGESDYWLDYVDKEGIRQTKKGKWEDIFGSDGDSSSFLPYLWENSELHKAAASMGSEGGLHHFSTNFGTSGLIDHLTVHLEELRLERDVKVSDKMDDKELSNYKELADKYKQKVTRREQIAQDLKDAKNSLKRFSKYGDFSAYATNYTAVENSNRLVNQRERQTLLSIQRNAQDRVYSLGARAAFADFLETSHGLPRGQYPTANASTSEVYAAKALIEDLDWAIQRLVDVGNEEVDLVVEEIQNIAKNELFFELNTIVNSDSESPRAAIQDTIKAIDEFGKAKALATHAKSKLSSSGVITDAEFSAWKGYIDQIDTLEKEDKELKKVCRTLKEFSDDLVANQTIDSEIKSLSRRVEACKLILGAVINLKETFEVRQRAVMLDVANTTLSKIPVVEKFKLHLEDDMVLPKVRDVAFPLRKTDKADGPSAGQGRIIANSVMLARYTLTECQVPLILDDAFEKIDEFTTPRFFQKIVDDVASADRQLIWVQNHLPFTAIDEFVLIFGYPKEIVSGIIKNDTPPWDGTALKPSTISHDEWVKVNNSIQDSANKGE